MMFTLLKEIDFAP